MSGTIRIGCGAGFQGTSRAIGAHGTSLCSGLLEMEIETD